MANAVFEGVRAALNYWVFHLRGVLQSFLMPTPREQTVLTLLYRAIGCLASIRRLNLAIHLQSVSGATRSLFEIGVDLALLHQDRTDNSVERIEAFKTVEIYRVFKKQVDYYASHPVPEEVNIEQQQNLVAEVKLAEIERLIQLHWGRGRNRAGNLNWPKHWSAFSDARSRAQAVGDIWEERYVRQYYLLSWYIHPGLTGVTDLPKEHFDHFLSTAHYLVTEMILDCYDVVGSELQLADAIPKWADHLFFLRHAIGLALVDEQLQTLGEPVRFTYLEPHEHEIDH